MVEIKVPPVRMHVPVPVSRGGPPPQPHVPVPPAPVPQPPPPPITEADIINSAPWQPQENAAYTRMTVMLLNALADFQAETQANGQLLDTSLTMAIQARSELEQVAYQAWTDKMAAARDLIPAIVSPAMENRARQLTSAYKDMAGDVADAWAAFSHWMNLAENAYDAIAGPAQQSYDHRMEAAYTAMWAACNDAEATWQRMYNPAQRAGTLLSTFSARAGAPPNA